MRRIPMASPSSSAADDTPRVDNLLTSGLLTNNPNAVQPFRLDRSQYNTCDQNHNYLNEQEAVDHGLVDNYVAAVGSGDGKVPAASPATVPPTLPAGDVLNIPGNGPGTPYVPGQFVRTVVTGGTAAAGPYAFSGYCFDAGKGTGVVMGYYDGNTVTALWNYAQHFAMSDNSWSTTLWAFFSGSGQPRRGNNLGGHHGAEAPQRHRLQRIRPDLGRPDGRCGHGV